MAGRCGGMPLQGHGTAARCAQLASGTAEEAAAASWQAALEALEQHCAPSAAGAGLHNVLVLQLKAVESLLG